MRLTVAQLKQQLADMPDDLEVYSSQSSGDYWHTELAIPVRQLCVHDITWSEYHRTYKTSGDGDDADHPNKTVLLLG